MADMEAGTLPVPGATLYYEVRGTGPLLLILQGGDGDAGRSADLVDRLVGDHTVVTYDRRGLSRSTPHDPARPVTIETHADDVHRLLAALTDRPALMFGSSFGGLIGLTLAVRHPGQVSVLVAHEPGAIGLLSAGRARFAQALEELQETYRRQGVAAAMHTMSALVGIDPAGLETEPGVRMQEQEPGERAANLRFLLANDMPALSRSALTGADVAALKDTPIRIVPAAGRTTPRTVFPRRCAGELAGLLGTQVMEFPGCHNGNTTHPRAFAARLREVLHGTA
ncbi:alpha/beta fold hydrolase [Streptosporangium minutum]|uniref:Alpha/beta hydrolase n=1 Tax=Streptosporangium minutum TaxID=569862 RepID=A0A243RAP2_9ACTN|nr:alpha/beta hydrolase [Streptosporangium minutum]OUC91724.1 alpha/beta hydrolase [Streptosporangium minutum]